MPTNTEKIDEVSKLVATLTERLDNTRRETQGIAGLETRIALLEQHVVQTRANAEEAARRRWSLVPVIVGIVLGGVMTLFAQAIISLFR